MKGRGGRLTVIFVLFAETFLFAQVGDFENINFRQADSVALMYPYHSLRDIRVLALKLTKDLPTDVEKFRAIYLWVCSNIENDLRLFQESKEMRDKEKDPTRLRAWNKKFYHKVIASLLRDHRTLCTGYAYLIRELALQAGLSCEMIDGYGRTIQSNIGGIGIPNHSWNAVRLNQKWYLCDATWSSGSVDEKLQAFVNKYNDNYFLTAPELFIRNHYPLDTAWTLMRQKPSLNEFLNGPLVYADMFKFEMSELMPGTFKIHAEKGKVVSMGFDAGTNNSINRIELLQVYFNSVTSENPPLDVHNGRVSFQTSFSRKGPYVLHVLLNGVMAYTYSVDVK